MLKSSAAAFLVDKGNYRHFMAKEIHEQPEVVGHTLAHYLDMAAERVRLPTDVAVRLSHARSDFDFRVRHGLLRRTGRQILVRALCRACRSRSTSLPSSATASRR